MNATKWFYTSCYYHLVNHTLVVHVVHTTEKEINFLILFSNNSKPLSRKFVLEKVWNYSSESETHTVETHVHRLRKKILEKFNDNNFIKNNNEGYYI